MLAAIRGSVVGGFPTSIVWFGATDAASEGTWVWVDGTPFDYSNWNPGRRRAQATLHEQAPGQRLELQITSAVSNITGLLPSRSPTATSDKERERRMLFFHGHHPHTPHSHLPHTHLPHTHLPPPSPSPSPPSPSPPPPSPSPPPPSPSPPPPSPSPPPLGPGDCLFVALKTDDPDNFGLLLLKTLGYSETLYVTDDEYLSPTGPFASSPGELYLSYRNGVVDVPAGTVLQLSNFTGGVFAASDLGDQLFAYVGGTRSPNFVCGITNEVGG
eukprot:jgi/Chrpa1/26039/Chrysochromulina_OHIO_Genome00026258-RA